MAHPEEAGLRRRVFELFVEHKKKSVVASELNHEGYRTRTGSIFSAQSVGRILQDDIVLGNATTEQIVDTSLFKQCQAILSEQSAKGGARRSASHLLAGLLYCQPCGEKMYVPSHSRKYVCQSCRLKIGCKDIETVTLRHLESIADKTLRQLLIHWPNLSLADQREILETQIIRIEIDANHQIKFVMLL